MVTKKKSVKKSRIVLIRSGQSGVWIGEFVSHKGDSITLKNANKIWRWRGANTTSELAMNGCVSGGFTRVAKKTDKVTVLGCCEIHESSAEILEKIRLCGWAV